MGYTNGTKYKEDDKMNYEIVEIEEKMVAGISASTNYNSPDVPKVIGGLWEKFYADTYPLLNGKTNEKSIGLYTDYSENGGYKVMVCSEVDTSEQTAETMTIPAGKYAKFVIKGNIVTAVQEFWQQLWNTNLERAFICDFEEYQGGEDMDNMEIHMYISVKS